jgi:hypothetical protein
MDFESELAKLLPLIEHACTEHNAYVSTSKQITQRLLEKPEEAVAAFLVSKRLDLDTTIADAIEALDGQVAHRESKRRMEEEWEGYRRGLRTHTRVWEMFFRGSIAGEERQFQSGPGSYNAFKKNVTFRNLEHNALWMLGSENVKIRPTFLPSIGSTLQFGSKQAMAAAVASSSVSSDLLVQADPSLSETMRSAMETMKGNYTDKLALYHTDRNAVDKVEQELRFQFILDSIRSDTFTQIANPPDAKQLQIEHRDRVKAGVQEWLRLFTTSYNERAPLDRILAVHNQMKAEELQITACLQEAGYKERLLNAQNAYYRAVYHQQMSTLYCNLCSTIANHCRSALTSLKLVSKKDPNFEKMLGRVRENAERDVESFRPPVAILGSDKTLVDQHATFIARLDVVASVKQLMTAFNESLRINSSATYSMKERMRQFGTDMNPRIEIRLGVEWSKQVRDVHKALGLDNEVAIRERGKVLTYADILKVYAEALETHLKPLLAQFMQRHRPIPSILEGIVVGQTYLVDAPPFFAILSAVASAVLKKTPPNDLNPADAIQFRIWMEQITREASKGPNKCKMEELCLYALRLRLVSLV